MKLCGKDFSKLSNFKNHIMSVHEGHNYKTCIDKTPLKDQNDDLKHETFGKIEVKDEFNKDQKNETYDMQIKVENIHDLEESEENVVKLNEDPLNINLIDNIKSEFDTYNPNKISTNLSATIEFIDQDDHNIKSSYENQKDNKCEICGKNQMM